MVAWTKALVVEKKRTWRKRELSVMLESRDCGHELDVGIMSERGKSKMTSARSTE